MMMRHTSVGNRLLAALPPETLVCSPLTSSNF